jgi:hypothetical protein
LIKRFPERLRHQTATLKVGGKARTVRSYDAEMLWRGVWHDHPCPVRLIIGVVPGLRLQPGYLLTTDLELTPLEAVQAYGGRQPIEVNFDEVKECWASIESPSLYCRGVAGNCRVSSRQ